MGHDCPTCGKELTSERGMRQHHTKVHDEPLPNRTCSGRGAEFYDQKARLEYCDECHPNAGENNGNWKGARESAECEACGETFEYYPSDKDGVYCPECVAEFDGFIGTPAYEVWDVERLERECEYCGAEMEVLECNLIHGAGRFCSRDCHSAWMSDNWQGEDHPAWGGETSGNEYVKGWWSVREKALERDDHECQRCGTGRDELRREPDVHHIKPIREFEDYTDAHTLNNVVTLCPGCHNKVEHGKAPVPAFDE